MIYQLACDFAGANVLEIKSNVQILLDKLPNFKEMQLLITSFKFLQHLLSHYSDIKRY